MMKGVIRLNKTLKDKLERMNISAFSEFSLPHISISSNREAVVDGCLGVIEYCNESIRLNCKSHIVKFTGEDMCMKTVTSEQYVISGNILTVEYCSC